MAKVFITNPTLGIGARIGSYLDIRWNRTTAASAATKNVTLSLMKAGVYHSTIVTGRRYLEPNEYRWEIPSSITPGSDYQIWFVTADGLDTGASEMFTVLPRKTLGEFEDLVSLKKSVLFEIRAGYNVPSTGWVFYLATGGNRYRINIPDLPELTALWVNGVRFTRVLQAGGMTAASTFWVSPSTGGATGIIEIHLADHTSPDDNPGIRIVGEAWVCFSNRENFFRPGSTIFPTLYRTSLESNSVPSLSQKVSDFYTGAVSIQFGSVSVLNDGWLWKNRGLYYFHNKECFVKLGELGAEYQDHVIVFPGRIRNPVYSDKTVIFELEDQRAGMFGNVPTDVFLAADYPDMDPGIKNKVKPILFGVKTGIIPPCIDTVNRVYLVSDCSFPGGSFPLSSIDAVRLDGVPIYVGTNYTVSLSAGTITLLDDPGDAVLSIDAHGIKCAYNFTTGAATGLFTENVADILYFILKEVAGVPAALLDSASFGELQTKRTQRIGFYLGAPLRAQDAIRDLQVSALFHLVPTTYGGFMVRYYDRDAPADALRLYSEDLDEFELREETDAMFQSVVLQYDKDPSSDTWREVVYSTPDTDYKHDEMARFTVRTLLVAEAEADALAEFYGKLIQDPAEKISAYVPPQALQTIPTDKVIVSRSTKGIIEGTVTICEEELYLVLEAQKDMASGRVRLQMIRDTQARGEGGHADVDHEDSHSDSHVDEHTDGAHTDTHSDRAHTDSHSDSVHLDHVDGVYSDVHEDQPYYDHMDGIHEDEPHHDHYDGYHTETHTDVAHVDSHSDLSHLDTHSDGHADSYIDDHTDAHADIPHTDSYT